MAALIGNHAAKGTNAQEKGTTIMEHQAVSTLAFFFLLLAFYFLPTIVSSGRRHRQHTAIGVLNLLAGWTAIGWIVAIVWACTDDVHERPQQNGLATHPASQKAIAVAEQYQIRGKLISASVGIVAALLFISIILMAPR